MNEWEELVGDFKWMDSQFVQRDVSICFVTSRLRAVKEADTKGRAKLLQLSFEDFLEVLVRVATRKALPTDDEVRKAGYEDGSEHLFQLKLEPKAWSAFLVSHNVPWGAKPLQPLHRALDHLIASMFRAVSKGKSSVSFKGKLSEAQVRAFQAQVKAFQASARAEREPAIVA